MMEEERDDMEEEKDLEKIRLWGKRTWRRRVTWI